MPVSYSSGRRFEWSVRSVLESYGWVTVRAARSKPVDLVALKDGRILLIECKYNARISSKRMDYLKKLAEKAGAKPLLAVKKKYERSITFIDVDAGGEVDIEEV
jgi:Holliday junction resolvase